MNKIEGCIFDLDGVVVDTAKYHFLAWRKLASQLGFEFNETDNERLKGVSRLKSLEILLEVGGMHVDKDDMDRLAEMKNKWYLEYILKMDKSEILPGVEEFIDTLRDRHYIISLGSVSKNAPAILERVELKSKFDAIIDGNKVSKAKPDPEVFLKAAEEMGLSPDNCVVFEDAAAGIDAAINAGMRSIGVGSPQVLYKADIVIPGFLGITPDKLFDRLNLNEKQTV